MTEQQADTKIAKIISVNHSNNQLLSTIKLGLGFGQSKFPNKFSQDLYDIQTTSIIQSRLIQEILTLYQQLTKLQSKVSQQARDMTFQIQRQRKNSQHLQSKTKQLTLKISKLQQFEIINMKLQSEVITLKNQTEKLKSNINQYQREIKKYKDQNYLYQKIKQSESKRHNWNKGFNKFESIDFQPFKNNQHSRQMTKINDWTKIIDYERKSNRQKQLEKDNQKLTEWLKQFVQRIERILQIRLQKLRQTATSEEDINELYQYLPTMHLKTVTHFEKLGEFPFAALLNDFQFIVRQAEQITFKHDLNEQNQKTQAQNKRFMSVIIDEMVNWKSQIVEEFKMCGDKRQQIAEYYEIFMKNDNQGLDVVSNISLDKLREFQTHPRQIINEIDQEIEDLKMYKKKMSKNHSSGFSYMMARRSEIDKEIEKKVESLFDKQKHKQFKQKLKAQFQLQYRNQYQQEQEEDYKNLSQEQREQRQYEKLFKKAKKLVLSNISQKKFQQELEDLNSTMKSQDLKQLRKGYMALLKLKNNQQQNQDFQDPLNSQFQKPKMQEQNFIKSTHKSSNNNLSSNYSHSYLSKTSNNTGIFNSNPIFSNSSQRNQSNKKIQSQSQIQNYPPYQELEI